MDISFLNRLRSLQNLCSTGNNNNTTTGTKPQGLLFINGPDGKNNRGTQTILKYLFCGAVGKDLYEGGSNVSTGYIDENNDDNDDLDEIVLFIQKNSVSVLWK